ncbi:MAG: hypothetical protein JJ992_01835 [Planctomycetes bacterium]|nr:hypothetical protein [Planctomycetota bacterium]
MAEDMRDEMGLRDGYWQRDKVNPDDYVDSGLARRLNRAIARIETLEYERDELAKVVGGDVELGLEMRQARDVVRAYRADNRELTRMLEHAYHALYGGPNVDLVNAIADRLELGRWEGEDE